MAGPGQIGQFTQGRIKIDQLDQGTGGFAASLHFGSPNDQRDTGGYFVIGRFSPDAHVPQMPTMIAPDHDHGVVPDTRFVESLEHHSDLRIDITDAGIISMQEGLGQLRANRSLLGNTMAGAQLEGSMQPRSRPTLRALGLLSQFDFFTIIQIPIFFRGDEIEMRLFETEGQKERLLGFLLPMILQGGDGEPGAESIGIGMVGNVCRLVSRAMNKPARTCLSILRQHLFLVRCPKFLVLRQGIVTRQPLHLHRTTSVGGLPAPGMLVVRHSAMINLSTINRFVSMLDEMLGQGNDFGIQLPKIGCVLDHAYLIRSGACHQARPGRTANGLLTIGPVKAHAFLGKLVQVGGLDNSRAIATELRPQVINRNEQNVRRLAEKQRTC